MLVRARSVLAPRIGAGSWQGPRQEAKALFDVLGLAPAVARNGVAERTGHHDNMSGRTIDRARDNKVSRPVGPHVLKPINESLRQVSVGVLESGHDCKPA